jgi:hypothetical protein
MRKVLKISIFMDFWRKIEANSFAMCTFVNIMLIFLKIIENIQIEPIKIALYW